MLDTIIGQDRSMPRPGISTVAGRRASSSTTWNLRRTEGFIALDGGLPLYAMAETDERPYLLVHAGIQTEAARAF